MHDLSFEDGSGFFWRFSFSLYSLAPALASGLNYFPHRDHHQLDRSSWSLAVPQPNGLSTRPRPQQLFEIFTQPSVTIVAPNHYHMSIDQCNSRNKQTNARTKQTMQLKFPDNFITASSINATSIIMIATISGMLWVQLRMRSPAVLALKTLTTFATRR